MKVEALVSLPHPDWPRMRAALWPDGTADEHLADMQAQLDEPRRYAQFIARDGAGRALGFVEAALRTDYVNGCESSPVAFLEGVFVEPAARRQAVARALVQAVVAWARGLGSRELASDAGTDNLVSQAVHLGLGFVETERVVYYRRLLGE